MDTRNVTNIHELTSNEQGFKRNNLEVSSKCDIFNSIFEAEILPIPAIKMTLEQRESFWHANGHRKRKKHDKIDLRLAGYAFIWTATVCHNSLCQKKYHFFLILWENSS